MPIALREAEQAVRGYMGQIGQWVKLVTILNGSVHVDQ